MRGRLLSHDMRCMSSGRTNVSLTQRTGRARRKGENKDRGRRKEVGWPHAKAGRSLREFKLGIIWRDS